MSISSMSTVHADASDRLFSLARAHMQTVVLLDPFEPLQGHLQDLIEGRRSTCRPLKHPAFTGPTNTAPLLVQLDGQHDPLLDESLALACKQIQRPEGVRQVGGWLFGSEPLGVLAERIGQRMDVTHRSKRRQLRLHDPRVQTCLMHMLDDPDRAPFCAGMMQWLSLCEDGTLQIFSEATDRPYPSRTRQVDGATWQRLHDIGTINRAVSTMRRLGHAYNPQWTRQIGLLVQRARKHGYDMPFDQVAFAVHGMTVHTDFDTHPHVRDALASARERGHGFCQAVAAFTPAQLQAIADDLAYMPARKGLPA